MGPATEPPTEKSPKTTRRSLKTPLRQVRFEDSDNLQTTTAAESAPPTNANSNSNSNSSTNSSANTESSSNKSEPAPSTNAPPTNFPALGPQPGAQQQRPLGQGYTFFTLGQTVSQISPVLQLSAGTSSPHPHLSPHHQSTGIAMAADYQNTVPPVHGLNFQPPVPDNSHGPMNHVYIPRFDGGIISPHSGLLGVQARLPSPPALGGFQRQQPGYIVQPQAAYIQQPVMVNDQPPIVTPGPQLQAGPPAGGFVGTGPPPVSAGNTGPAPDVAGLGRMAGEEQLRQHNLALSNKLFEPQEFKPSDDDPSRFYYVRELDGNWTQRNRFSIDHMGDCRWYITDEGWFYAVRLPN